MTMVHPDLLSILTTERLEHFSNLLAQAKEVCIICHARPDGDAIGSMLALGLILQQRGHQVTCIAPTRVPKQLRWLPGKELLATFHPSSPRVPDALSAAQLLIHVDHNDIDRADPPLAELIRASNAPRVLIDHHLHPTDEFSLAFSFTGASSTCELLYELAIALWGEGAITPQVAMNLYTGLMTDTGSFSYSCSRLRTFEVGGLLMRAGADIPTIRSHVFGSYSHNRYRLYGVVMADFTYFFADGRAALIVLPQWLLQEYYHQPGDTEGLVNEPLTVEGVVVSAMLSEQFGQRCRISLRSRDGVEVNSLAREFFNGGGHPQASGGSLEMPLRKARLYSRLVISRELIAKLPPPTEQ